MSIWKLALLTLIKRKKMFILLISIVTFAILSMLTLDSTIETINWSLLEKTYLKYGEHHFILHDINQDDREYLRDSTEVDTFSEYALVGVNNINKKLESLETLGWVDSSTLTLGRINFIEGRMPSQKNEIAIESFYATRGSFELGTHLNIKVGESTEKFRIVGIVSDYSMNWAAPPVITRGSNDLPNVFLYKEDLYKFGTPSYHTLVKLNGSPKEVQNNLYSVLNNFDPEERVVNEFLFNSLLTNINTQNVAYLLQFFLWVTSSICILFIFNLFYVNYRKKISVFRTLGASKRRILLIILLQSLVVVSVSTFIALPFSLFFSQLMAYIRLGESIRIFSLSKVIFLKLIVWLVITYIGVFIGSLLPLIWQFKRSVAENMNYPNKYPVCFKNNHYSPFWFKWSCIQVRSSIKHTLLIVFTLSLSTLLMFLGYIFAKEVTSTSSSYIDFYINSQTWHVEHQFHGFPISVSEGPIFNRNDLDQLEKLEGIEYVDKQPIQDGISLLLTNEQLRSSPYLKDWVETYQLSDTPITGIPSLKHLGISDDLQVIPHVNYVILNDDEFAKLNEQYFDGELNSFTFQNNPIAVVFLPSEGEMNKTLKVSADNNIKLGQIKKDPHSKEVNYYEWDFTVEHFVPYYFSLEINENIEKSSSKITVVLHQDINKKMNIFRGFSESTIYVNNLANKNQRSEIEYLVKKIVSPIPGSFYESMNDISNEEKANSNFIRIFTLFLFISTVAFSIVSIVAIMYGRFLTKQRQWGIFKSLGITKKQISIMHLIEVSIYVAISNLFVFVFVILFLLTQPLYGEGVNYFSFFIFSILFVHLLSIIIVMYLLRIIHNMSISSLLRAIV
ncbi:putative ABC transport system permease protein [Natronobacillus azotifigens]|uniref:ABC transporter permease n=1 Tax=Natronobacillus azotifigens TaxID=472978 RepID=A0A9J6RBK1_9BACI|nr:ABC transporter permease [Natronobacillus azotifigens]MCZ0703066.1 ABC transporter permease [Natronobacillus azotifigens]